MKSRLAAACLLASVVSTGCDIPFLGGKDKDEKTNPTGPSSPTVSLDAFAGTWSSVNESTPAAGCGNVKYTITPTTATSATVTFTATCAGNIAVSGSGTGTLSGDTLNWSGNGLVSQGGVNCPFSFTNSRATLNVDGTITINYTGTVCGVPVSGTEVVRK